MKGWNGICSEAGAGAPYEGIIVAAARTPIGRAGRGSLAAERPDDLLGLAIAKSLEQVPSLGPDTSCATCSGTSPMTASAQNARPGVLGERCPSDDKLATLRAAFDEFQRTDSGLDDANRTVLGQPPAARVASRRSQKCRRL